MGDHPYFFSLASICARIAASATSFFLSSIICQNLKGRRRWRGGNLTDVSKSSEPFDYNIVLIAHGGSSGEEPPESSIYSPQQVLYLIFLS